MLSALLRKSGRGRPVKKSTVSAQKRRVNRKDQTGLAMKVAVLFESILLCVNEAHNLDQFPLTLKHTLACMKEGKPILEDVESNHNNEVAAQANLEVLKGAGSGHKGTVLGVIAKKNVKGKLSSKQLAMQDH